MIRMRNKAGIQKIISHRGTEGAEDKKGRRGEDERVLRVENLEIKSNLRIFNYKSFEELS